MLPIDNAIILHVATLKKYIKTHVSGAHRDMKTCQ
jgi:hypothetical protein